MEGEEVFAEMSAQNRNKRFKQPSSHILVEAQRANSPSAHLQQARTTPEFKKELFCQLSHETPDW